MVQLGELKVPIEVNPGNGVGRHELISLRDRLAPMLGRYFSRNDLQSSVSVQGINHSYIHSHPVTGAFLLDFDFGFEKSVFIFRPCRENWPGLKAEWMSRFDGGRCVN